MKHALKLLAGLAVSLVVLGLLLKLAGGSDAISLDGLLEMARRISVPWLLAGLAGTLLQAATRARRYALLLIAAGEPRLPPRGHLLLVTMARNMCVDLLPMRLGELVYVGLLNRGFQLRMETCLSSLGLSVLFDFAALLLLVLGLVLVHLAGGHAAGWLGIASLVLAVVLAVGLALLFRGPAPLARWFHRWRGWPPIAALSDLLGRLDDAFTRTRSAGVFGRVLAWSMLVRLSKYAGFYALFRAVTEVNFPSFATASPPDVIGALLTAEGASSVPVPSFMSFGTYEAGGTAVWTALGFPAAAAAVCMFVIHVVSQAMDYSLGGGALLALLARRASGTSGRSRRPAWIAAVVAALVAVAAGIAAWDLRALQKQGAREAPPAGHPVPEGAQAAGPLPEGFIVWCSNRAGNHDLWRMDLPGRTMTRLTTDAHAEYHPRISPDGRSVVFARARRPWVSQRNELDWDVVLLDLETGRERVLAERANAPSWSGPDAVVCQRDGSRVERIDLATGRSAVLCEAGRGGVPDGVRLQTPSERAGVVAATLRGSVRGTYLFSAGQAPVRVGDGCQLEWQPDGTTLLGVQGGGRMKNAIFTVDPATLGARRLFDAPDPWSHEYFPRLSADGRWLVYGAAAQGHEHDTADYEIFLWAVGADGAAPTRLTWHTGNDGWPDIWVRREAGHAANQGARSPGLPPQSS